METEPSSTSIHPPNSNSVPLIVTFCVISAVLIFLVFSENFIFGSKSGNWTYPYFDTITSIPVWIPAVVLILLGILIFLGSKLILSYERMTLIGCLIIVFVMQSLIHTVYPVSLGTIVESNKANSFYTPAMRYSPNQILTNYNELIRKFPLHAKSNMPGKILLFQLFELFTSSPQRMGYLVILISSLGGLLLYGICKKLFHDRRTAFYALVLYALVPAKLSFFPILNTVTPLFLLLCLYLFVLYIEVKQIILLLLLGVAIYILILFEPTPLVTGIIFVGILIHAILEKRLSKKELWRLLIIPLASFLCVYILFSIFFSFNLLQVFRSVLASAVNFNIKDHRDYWIWLGENPKEFFYGVGLPVAMIFIYLTSQIFSRPKILKSIAGWSIENVFVLSLLATFCVVEILGINRGEITRLWIYLAVLFQVPAAFFLAKIPHSKALFFLVASTLVVQSIITLQRVGFIIP